MNDIQPSVRFEPGSPKPLGFVDHVGKDHAAAIKVAFDALSEAVNDSTAGADPILRVRFGSVRFSPLMPFVLYGFHVQHVDVDGNFSDAVSSDHELNYALIANHAIEVQRETAILFLYSLVFRQEVVRRQINNSAAGYDIDILTETAEQEARREFRDRIQEGWRSAAEAVAQRAIVAEMPIRLAYRVDIFSDRSEIARRIPFLKATYNEMKVAREVIDKQVALIGGRSGPRVSAPNISRDDESRLQGYIAALGIRQWMSQTERDAAVCGNGYLVISKQLPPRIYAVPPEEVEIAEDGRYYRINGQDPAELDGVMHVSGIEQFESPYGISTLEPILEAYREKTLFDKATAAARQIIRSAAPASEAGSKARQLLELADRNQVSRDERLRRLLEFAGKWLGDAEDDLYFPGQERMR